jgi:hypothetical protein
MKLSKLWAVEFIVLYGVRILNHIAVTSADLLPTRFNYFSPAKNQYISNLPSILACHNNGTSNRRAVCR